ncbi:MAG: GTPase HflX [Gammaproteobacteria bacterium]|nr:GTPase HflX [Gammaproteobacteria bacterium]
MFTLERHGVGEVAIIVHVNFPDNHIEELDEFIDLVNSAGVEPASVIQASRQRPDAKFFIGSGKLSEIKQSLIAYDADLVLFNHALSPAQERNIEKELQCRVLDRTGVILDIFAQRARSHEGKLQVELAQLTHISTRLVRGWTHLERQKGGIGLRGPGETQLETDRRLINDRIKQLKKRLQKVHNQRQQSRRSRQRAKIPTVSLVGYTNAGKSSLFNQLSSANVYAENQLFATLDPTLKRIDIDQHFSFVLADTVGFIRSLPHDLVNAFHATLEEVKEADLLLHVVDVSDGDKQLHIDEVDKVIKLVGADIVPQIIIYNKIDLLDKANHSPQNSLVNKHSDVLEIEPKIIYDEFGQASQVMVSALKNIGMELINESIKTFFSTQTRTLTVQLSASMGKLRAKLYQLTSVNSEQVNNNGEMLIEFTCTDEQYQLVNKNADLEELFIET